MFRTVAIRSRAACVATAVLFVTLACNPIYAAAAAKGPVTASDYKDPIKLACVGDSITFGAGIKDREHDSYPAQLQRMLGDKWVVKNFGNSGSTLLKKGDKPYDKQKQYSEALAFKPDVIVVKLGTNDSKPQNWAHQEDFVGDYKDLIGAFRKVNPGVRVFAALPVPAFPENFKITDKVIKNDVIPQIRKAAEETDATLIDLYAALEGKKELFPDKVHPNAEGARLMANAVYHALTGKDAPATKAEGADKK